MKIKYESDKDLLKELARGFGLAVGLAGFLNGALADGDLLKTSIICTLGAIIAVIGTLRKKKT